MAKRKDRTRDGQKLGPAYHIKSNPSQTVSLRNENFGMMARKDKKADKNTPLSTPMDHLRKETPTYTQMYSGKGKNKTKTVQSSWNRNGGKSGNKGGKSGNQPKPMNRDARIMSATLSDSHKRPAIMATDQAKRELEADNDRNNSPMGTLRRRARKAQTGQADNYSREEADKRLFSETLSSARKAEKNYKKAFEENRYTGGSKTLLSGADTKNLSEEEQNNVQVWKDEWDKGQRLIDQGYTQRGKQMQAEAHAQAERIRMTEGYSGGESGSDFTTPEIRQDEYAGMSDSGRKNLRVAKSLYEFGQKTGDEELMKQAAQMGQQVRLEPSSYDYKRSEAYHKFAEDRPVANPNTDAHGRPIYTPNEWEQEQNKKWGTAVGQGLKGGFLTLLETARKATQNAIANRYDPEYQSKKYTAEYLQHEANKEQDEREKIRLNAKAAKMRGEADDAKAKENIGTDTPGMQALRASSEATEDLVNNAKTGGGKLLTKAGISMLQMAPFLAANVIPGAGQAISLGGMGALAAGQKAGELQQDNRVSAQEAFARGLVSGGIEAFTEKIPMDSLLKLVKGGGGANFIKAVAKQAGIEATEESASYTMNWLADKAARDPKAKFSLSDLAENAAIGAISGAAFGAGGHVIGSAIGAGRTPYNNPSPTEDTTPTPTVEKAPRPIQEQPTQESANPLIRASQVQEQKPTVKEQVAEKRWQRKRLLELNEQEQELNERFKSANKRAFSAKTDAEMQEAINEQNEITAERARISNEREELEARLSVPFHPDLQTRTQEVEPVQEPTRSAKERLEAAQQAYRQRIQEQAQANQDTREQMQSARERLVQARQALAQREAAWQERAANATEEEVPDLLREQETLLQAERQIQAQEAQAEREDAGQLSRNFGEEAAHIDQRTAGDVSKPSVKAFQWDYPQMHQYYAQAAEALLQDVEYSKAGQFSEKGRGTVVTKSEAMTQAERMGISRADLEKALIAIINDQGQENYATAKKVELVLDEMLSKGYIPNEAGYSANKVDSKVPPNEAYITAKEAIPGAVKRGSFEAYKEQNRLALELGEITEEQLYQEWEQGQTLAQSQAQFDAQSQAQTQPSEKKRLTGSLLDNLRENRDAIAEGGILARMDGSEFAPSGKHIVDQVSEFFASLGNKVTRLGFGDIALTRRSAKSSVAHGMGRNKAIAFAAVPSVIENGIVIDEQTNWKGRGTDSVTFGGRVQIGDKIYDMGVIVHKYGKESPNYGKYYLHEVLLTDEDGATVPIETRTLSGYPSDTVTPSSMDSVAQEQGAVNEENVNENNPGLRDSLGSARAGFDPYSEAMNRYGTIEPGMNPSRMVDVPKRMNPYTKVSKYARTLAESESLPDALMENFEQDVVSGLYNYAPKKQQDSLDRAVKTVEAKGWDGALEQWHEVVDGMRECTDDDLILAQVLLSTAAQANDTAAVSNLSAQIAAKGTEAGRMVNSLKLLKRTTPEGRLYYIQHVIDKMNSDYSKKGLDTKIEMDPDLAALLLDSEDTESMDDAMDQIYDNIAEQVPNTLTDYLDAWRYFAMLGNPRTHIRNAIGNVIFRGAMGARNVVSAGLQRALIPENQRTRTLTQSKEYMDFAKADLENAMDELTGNKYTDEFGEVRKRQLETLYPKPIQALMNTSTKGMEYMDLVAKKFTYVRDMANFLKARNVDLENIPKGMLEEARNHAVEQAKYSTFQQYSDLAHALSVHEQNGVAGKLLIGGMVPFKRTPINIAKAAVDFSPIGLAKGLNRTVRDVRKGLYTAGESIDQLAAGMTGTGIMVLGYFMAKMGLVSASGDDNDKQAGFDTAQGTQNYALNIPLPNGDTYSYTIDWAAPAAIPLFIGAEFFNSLAERDGEQTAVEVALDSIGKLFEPLLATTMLSGISSSIKSASYSSSNPIYGVLGNVASNYAGQFVPTLLSQIAKTVDPVRRSTFYDANSKVPKELQRFLQRQGAKIPGLSEKMPEYLDVWGRNDVGSDNVLIRALENFVSPGYVKKLDSSSMESELQRLNDAGYEGMLPSALQKSAKLDGNRMTAEQWMKRQKEQGGTAYEIIKDFMGTQEYQNLTDDQKAKFVDKAYEYAKNSGKAAAGGDTSDFAKWYEAANNAQSETGLSKERFLSLYAYKSAIEDEAPDEAKASLKQGMWEEYINGLSDLSQEQKDYVLDNVKFWQMMPADSGAYQKAKNAGYDTPEAIQALLEAKSSFSTDGNNDINNTEMYKGIIGQTSDPAEQEKMYNAIKDKDAKKSWKELAAEQSKQQQVESTAQAALDKAVSKDKQTAFATAMENATGTKQTDCYRALTSTGASEAECKAYFAYLSAQKGWKKSWEKVKADALKGK